MNKKEDKISKSLFIIGTTFIITGILLIIFYFFNQNQQPKSINKTNIENTKNIENIKNTTENKIGKKKSIITRVKKEGNIKIVFGPKMLETLIKKHGKKYILEYEYGVGYANNSGMIYKYEDDEITKEKKDISKKIAEILNKKCKGMNLNSIGGKKGTIKIIDEVLKYTEITDFLQIEKIYFLQDLVDKYCKISDKKSKNIIKKIILLKVINNKIFNKDFVMKKIRFNHIDNKSYIIFSLEKDKDKEIIEKFKEDKIFNYFFMYGLASKTTLNNKNYNNNKHIIFFREK